MVQEGSQTLSRWGLGEQGSMNADAEGASLSVRSVEPEEV